jgi:hypothetical protein
MMSRQTQDWGRYESAHTRNALHGALSGLEGETGNTKAPGQPTTEPRIVIWLVYMQYPTSQYKFARFIHVALSQSVTCS